MEPAHSGTPAASCQRRQGEYPALHLRPHQTCLPVFQDQECKFFSLTETPEDYTIIVDEEGFLAFMGLPSSRHLSVADATWLALNVVSGGGSFSSSQPIGVTRSPSLSLAPLADWGISVFMLSTYQTDFILCGSVTCLSSLTLSSEFTILRVVNGETVAAENLSITNGFVKPKMVQRQSSPPAVSLATGSVSPAWTPTRCPHVATLLIDVMFYSNGVKDPMAASDLTVATSASSPSHSLRATSHW
ncbi:Cytosolic arginine sensor for mTORC1 subunit 2 [Apodemus speciosus]|uniref:Cytosolic arginine sensor for mTORC1 subunit 2 n=1 Tax=Apodemus speciosus TaxID=105296 RepID=A0ABQ0ETZ5_APOSI